MFGTVAVGSGVLIFLDVVDEVYRLDFSSRLRMFEFDYEDVDARTVATEQVERERGAILDRLRERYIADGAMNGIPFAINGDREIQLYLEELVGTPASTFLDAAAGEILQVEDTGLVRFQTAGEEYLAFVHYYEPWDWYSGYLLPQSVRLAGPQRFATTLAIFGLVLIAVFAVLYRWYLNRAFRTLVVLPGTMQQFLDGDTSVRISASGADEIGRIASSFDTFAAQLETILQGIEQAAEQTATVESRLRDGSSRAAESVSGIRQNTDYIGKRMAIFANRIFSASNVLGKTSGVIDQLAEQITDQSSQVEQSGAAIDEISASLANVARVTEEKRESVRQLQATTDEGSQRLEETERNIANVQARASDIGRMSELIADMASQTDILSINAAIQASHAGESGRGFAVVAEEVRKLAGEAAKRSKEISIAVREIMSEIDNAVRAGADTRNAFGRVHSEVTGVQNAFEEISASNSQLATSGHQVGESMERLRQISATVREQSETAHDWSGRIQNGMKTVLRMSKEVDETVRRIAQEAGESDQVTDEVRRQAELLRESMEKLNESLGLFRR